MTTKSSRIQLTTKDVCHAIDVPRHVLRRWVLNLPPFSEADTRARSARRFDASDLLFFAVMLQLETDYGLRLEILQRISVGINSFLKCPRALDRFVFLDLESGQVESLGDRVPLRAGLIVDLDPAYRVVARYLGWPGDSRQMPLGLIGLG